MRRMCWLAATAVGFASISMLGLASAALGSATVPCSAGADGVMDALTAANSSGGGTIDLASGCTYQLSGVNNSNPQTGTNALPLVTSPITINGRGATIAGDGSARIIEVDGPSGNLTINTLTVTGGFEGAPVGAGGILNHGGTLTLNSSAVTGNTAFGGGGIATGKGNPVGGSSVTTLNKSRVDNNTANGGAMSGGGGIANGGTLQINNSEIADNTAPGGNGGGLLNHGDSATLNKTTVTGNTVPGGVGGGIANFNLGLPSTPTVALILNSSDVTANSADFGAGGILNLSFGAGAAVVKINPQSQVTQNNPDNCEPPGTIARCSG